MNRIYIAFALILTLTAGAAQAQRSSDEQRQPNIKTERAPVLHERAYKQLNKARELADAKQYQDALKQLSDVREDKRSNDYERAMAWNLSAYCYYEQNKIGEAIKAYNQVLAQSDIPDSLRNNTLYSLAQMNMATENWQGAVDSLQRWIKQVESPAPSAYLLLGQAYFQLKDYKRARQPIEKAVRDAQARGETVKENWWLLLRAIYYADNDYKNLLDVLKELAVAYPKREYWVQLSAVYGELNQPKKQLASMLTAYDQNMLSTEGDFINLGQLLLANEVPYRAAQVVARGLEQNAVKPTAQNLRLLADAWVLAKDYPKATEALRRAAKAADDGELSLRLAQVLMEQSQWREAYEAAQSALQRGGLKRPDVANIISGLALYEMKRLGDAQQAFGKAAQDDRSREMAQQWQQYIAREQERDKQLASLRASS